MFKPQPWARQTALALLCATAFHAAAQEVAPPPATPQPADKPADPPADAAKPEDKISVSGRQITDTDRRRNSSATKIIIGREEIARFGDNNLGDVLKRLPGVTIGGVPGRRGGEIRMRGLGSGYTQILVNGEPAARGFSLDSLSPELIERIEVIRAPLAEYSAQAVAGTINIVLREDARKRNSELSIAESITDNHKLQPRLSLQHSDRAGQLSYTLAGTVQHYDQLEASTLSEERQYDAQGNLLADQIETGQRRSRGYSLHFTPRLAWKFGEGDTLNFQLFAMHSQDVDRGVYQIDQPFGTAPYDLATARSESRFDMLRGYGNRQMALADGAKLNLRFGFNANRMTNTDARLEQTHNVTSRTTVDDTATKDHGFTTGGKWSTPLGEGHSLALGYDLDWSTRQEDRNRRSDALQPVSSDTSATALRLAGFGQDEWDISPQWSVYGGLRWESIRTRSDSGADQLKSRSAVWSPSVQGVWRLPDSKNDQVRMSLSRSYKAPRTSDLLARTVQSDNNKERSSPDVTGNPNLKPELAWGAEVSFEHYLSQNGLLSINLFNRRIENVVRRQVDQRADGTWLSTPINLDRATATGIELEGKFRMAELMDDAPPLDVRANVSSYWSHVSGIKGPDNRLDGQVAYSVNLGLDYRCKSMPLTIGGNLNWVPGYDVQTRDDERRSTGGKRVADLYALWKFSPATQLRLAASNLAHADFTGSTDRIDHNPDRRTLSSSSSRTWTNWTATLEMKF